MTLEDALAEVSDHYVPCCETNRGLIDAARTLAFEVRRLRELADVLRDQRDAARQAAQTMEKVA